MTEAKAVFVVSDPVVLRREEDAINPCITEACGCG